MQKGTGSITLELEMMRRGFLIEKVLSIWNFFMNKQLNLDYKLSRLNSLNRLNFIYNYDFLKDIIIAKFIVFSLI